MWMLVELKRSQYLHVRRDLECALVSDVVGSAAAATNENYSFSAFVLGRMRYYQWIEINWCCDIWSKQKMFRNNQLISVRERIAVANKSCQCIHSDYYENVRLIFCKEEKSLPAEAVSRGMKFSLFLAKDKKWYGESCEQLNFIKVAHNRIYCANSNLCHSTDPETAIQHTIICNLGCGKVIFKQNLKSYRKSYYLN